ncbi:unnamed protein product [Ilex paraguariensis]|uniref:Uncharacterized protein n=1 Tax=Ilex paraguariensis TaxID=185542 RepID=A0ABC8SDF4_9AQUA
MRSKDETASVHGCCVYSYVVYCLQNHNINRQRYDNTTNNFNVVTESGVPPTNLAGLPHVDLKPLWSPRSSNSKISVSSPQNLLAIPVGFKQKDNVDTIVQKRIQFLPDNFMIVLFHYDGNVNGWWDLDWSKKAIHIVAQNQAKWWFAKRFLMFSSSGEEFLIQTILHCGISVNSKYLEIVKSGGLEISQPSLDPNSIGIHHKITIRKRTKKFHTRIYDVRGSAKCSDTSEEPPCTGFVEGMAPVFSRSAWHCVWHLIQNDLVRGWGMDMKLGFCTQGDRIQKVGVVDSEYIVHQSIQTLGGTSAKKEHTVDARTEVRTCNMLAANKLGGNRRQSFVYSKSAGNKQWRRTRGGFIHSEASEDGSDEAFKAAESFA